ncbi:Lrp/AsnC family transcriptional regulator [Candidatus Woesearchaeota archaeon]|nr:Lrp/AsnC family transcriptional regulator [Candidatus Woesearchaeota archaeon]
MDLKNTKILFELSRNSRQSANQIAKKVGLSRDAVIYRMNSLEESGIIKKYMTVINLNQIGYRTHILFLEFKKFDINIEKDIILYLKNLPYSIWIASPSGKWDIVIDVISKDSYQFNEILMQLMNRLGDNLKNYDVLETIKEYYYNFKFLTGRDSKRANKRTVPYGLDEIDIKILSVLSQESRIPSTKIADKLKISHDRVSYRIKKMQQSGHIEQFIIQLDYNLIDLSYYYLLFQFTKLDKKTETSIVDFLRSQSEVLYIGKNAGKFNFNVDVIVKNAMELKQFILRFRTLFGDILESRESILMFEQHKNDYFPKCLHH